MAEVCWRKKEEMLYPRGMVPGEVVDHLVGAKRVSGQDDMFITFVLSKVQISLNILIGIGKAFVPGTDQFLLAGTNIDGADLPKGVVGLGIDDIDAAGIERITDVVIEGIGVKVAMDACDGDHHCVRSPLFLRTKQHTV